jgi:hypothetical protein
MIDQLSTCHHQILRPGLQVSYVTPIGCKTTATTGGDLDIAITGGQLRVARIVQIEEKSAGFAEADGTYELTLDDGAKVNAEDVAVTDGCFHYGTGG